MPLIWCSISSHGYGHAAQVVPVLNELAERTAKLTAVLRTRVPANFFEGRLNLEWVHSPAEQDIGCVQDGPLRIDVARTWAEHRRFHASWETRVREEAAAIRSAAPALVLSDISYLAIEAASRSGVPSVGLCNLSWDAVLEHFLEDGQSEQTELLRQIRRAYGRAMFLLCPMPGLPATALPGFQKVHAIGPIRQVATPDRDTVRNAIGAGPNEQVVLIGFGGVPLTSLPLDQLEGMNGFRFVVSDDLPEARRTVHPLSSIPLPFPSILASVDAVITKPGYSTIVETVAHQKPVMYVRRYNFADEAHLVEYLHRYGRGLELTAADFEAGRWQSTLEALSRVPHPTEPEPPLSGAAEAARALASYL